MTQRHIGPRRIAVSTAVVALIAGQGMAASLYSTGEMTFVTTERQNAWGEGEAKRIDETYTVGTAIGGESSGTASGGTYIRAVTDGGAAYDAWVLCRKQSIIPCGSEPDDPVIITPAVDTRTSATLTARTSGYLGAELNFVADAGSVAATVDYVATALVPDVGEVGAGETFYLNPMSDWIDGVLDNQTPTIEVTGSGIVDVNLDVKLDYSYPGVSGSTGFTRIIDTGYEKAELVSLDPKEIRFLDGIFPDNVEMAADLAKLEASAQAVVGTAGVTPKLVIDYPTGGQTIIGDPFSAGIEVANSTLEAPIISDSATKGAGDFIELKSEGDFWAMDADLDSMMTAISGVPVGATGTLGIASLTVDGFDAGVGPRVDLFQDLLLVSELHVALDFDRDVMVEGAGMARSWSGKWADLPGLAVFEKTVFTPVFSIVSTLTNKTGLSLDFEFVAELFKIKAGIAIPILPDLSITLGPVWETTIPLGDDLLELAFFDDTFMLSGFNTVRAEAFVVEPYAPTEVPLPAPVALLGASFLMLAAIRRRRATPQVR